MSTPIQERSIEELQQTALKLYGRYELDKSLLWFTDLVDFTKTFFSKHSLLSVLTRYCVFTTDKLLLVMRPYQIAAAELKYHGLLQAFSRTNRILNSVKTFGNIICFRDLEEATNKALSIFGNKEAGGIVLLKSYSDYYNGWNKEDGKHQRGYAEIIAELQERFPLPVFIEGEQAEKDFIRLWGSVLRLRNILSSFDEFAGNEILSQRDFQDYQSVYLDLYDKLRTQKDADKEIRCS